MLRKDIMYITFKIYVIGAVTFVIRLRIWTICCILSTLSFQINDFILENIGFLHFFNTYKSLNSIKFPENL